MTGQAQQIAEAEMRLRTAPIRLRAIAKRQKSERADMLRRFWDRVSQDREFLKANGVIRWPKLK